MWRDVTVQTDSRAASLCRVEAKIGNLVEVIQTSRVWLCKCLSTIERERLYLAIGASDFKDYLRRRRLPIAYQTAQQYALIGSVLQDYEAFLADCDYSEEDGLNKLRYLPRALANHDDHDEVASHIKKDSFRQFYAYANSQSEAATVTAPEPLDGRARFGRITFDDDTILVVSPEGETKEVVWLNPECFTSRSKYEAFVEMTLALVQSAAGMNSFVTPKRRPLPVSGRRGA